MIEKFSQFSNFATKDKIKTCFIDTSILFATSYPFDNFNDEAENLLSAVALQSISIFTNVNVRAEFLENHRKILIAECLIDFLDDFEQSIPGSLIEKLKSHRTSYRRKIKEEKSTKIGSHKISVFRNILRNYTLDNKNGWDFFCEFYLKEKFLPIWSQTENQFGLNFISSRLSDQSPYLNQMPEWDRTVFLMGHYGIASNDAMILNIFLCSKIPILLTADLEMAEVALKESQGEKTIFIPDVLLN